MRVLPQPVAKKSQKILLMSLAAVSGLTIAAELSLRYILGLGDPALSVAHPEIEYMFQPDQDVRRFGNRILVNQYGMRTQPISPAKQPDEKLRVMVFGDSVVNGGNLTDHQQLATTIVQNKLEDSENGSVVVGNISAGSWGPGNWLAYAREYGFFDADKIILVVSSHDYTDNPDFAPLDPNTHPQTKPTLALQEFYNRYLSRYLPKSPFKTEKSLAQTSEKANVSPTKNQGASDLSQFLSLAKSTGADVYVIQYWEKSEIKRETANKGNQKIAQLAEKLNLPVWQTKSLFVDAYSQNREPFRDNIHPSNLGQELLAQLMLDILNDKEQLQSQNLDE